MNKKNPFYPPHTVNDLEPRNNSSSTLDKVLSGLMCFAVGILFSVICLIGCFVVLETFILNESDFEFRSLNTTTNIILIVIHTLLGLIIFPIGLYRNLMKKKL